MEPMYPASELDFVLKLTMNLKGKTWAVCPAVLHLLLELIQDMCTSLIQPLMGGCWHTLLC